MLLEQITKLHHDIAAFYGCRLLPGWKCGFSGSDCGVDIFGSRKIDVVCYQGAIFGVDQLELLAVLCLNILRKRLGKFHFRGDSGESLTSLLMKRFLGRFDLLNVKAIVSILEAHTSISRER